MKWQNTWMEDDCAIFSSSAFLSMMVKTLSIPIETPTHGVWIPEGLNIPTRLSYRPPVTKKRDKKQKQN